MKGKQINNGTHKVSPKVGSDISRNREGTWNTVQSEVTKRAVKRLLAV